jgi:hypothetical protein
VREDTGGTMDEGWYVAEGGQTVGPLDRATLTGWQQQGRLQPTSYVWRDGMTGWAAARETPLAVMFEPAPPAPPPAPSGGPGGPAGPAWVDAPNRPLGNAPSREAGPWGSASGPGSTGGAAWATTPHAPHAVAAPPSNGLSIGAMVCGAVATLFFPILFGPLGIVLAGVGMSRDESKARTAMTVAVVGMVVGFVLGMLVWAA